MAVKHYQEGVSRRAPNTFPIVYLAVWAVLIYCLVLVIHGVIVGVSQAKIISEKQAELDQLQLQTAVQIRFLSYQKTPSYIDRQAREHFSYAKQGETTVILPQNVDQSQVVANEQAAQKAIDKQKVVSPHLQQWWQYFFGR